MTTAPSLDSAKATLMSAPINNPTNKKLKTECEPLGSAWALPLVVFITFISTFNLFRATVVMSMTLFGEGFQSFSRFQHLMTKIAPDCTGNLLGAKSFG
jgi:hypothetical protein